MSPEQPILPGIYTVEVDGIVDGRIRWKIVEGPSKGRVILGEYSKHEIQVSLHKSEPVNSTNTIYWNTAKEIPD